MDENPNVDPAAEPAAPEAAPEATPSEEKPEGEGEEPASTTPENAPADAPAPEETVVPDANESRTGFADPGLKAGDACTCPDGRVGTVHRFDAGLICLPNQG